MSHWDTKRTRPNETDFMLLSPCAGSTVQIHWKDCISFLHASHFYKSDAIKKKAKDLITTHNFLIRSISLFELRISVIDKLH